MQRKKYRVILDTNLWIKFLLSGGLEAIEILLAEDVIEVIVSPELLNEIEDAPITSPSSPPPSLLPYPDKLPALSPAR